MTVTAGKLVILTYHRIIADPIVQDPDEIDAAQFELHVDVLSKYFNVLTLDEAAKRLRHGDLPARAVSITFDDGYRDNVTDALPILKRHGVPATFFIATGYLDGGTMWNDVVIESVRRAAAGEADFSDVGLGSYRLGSAEERRAAIAGLLGKLKYRPRQERDSLCQAVAERLGVSPPGDLMMRTDDLVTLRDAGMEIGGHTRNHPILSVADDEEANAEIVAGKRDIEAVTGAEITSFAYPNGRPGKDYEARHAEMVRTAGFRQAVTTAAGCVSRNSDPFQLGRLSIWHRSRPKLLLRMLLNFFAAEAATARPDPT